MARGRSPRSAGFQEGGRLSNVPADFDVAAAPTVGTAPVLIRPSAEKLTHGRANGCHHGNASTLKHSCQALMTNATGEEEEEEVYDS